MTFYADNGVRVYLRAQWPVLLLLALAAMTACRSMPRAPFSSALASVNGSVITVAERNAEVQRSLARPATTLSSAQLAHARTEALEVCIISVLLSERAHDLALRHTDSEIDRAARQVRALMTAPSVRITPTPVLLSILGKTPAPSRQEVFEYYRRNTRLFLLPESVRARHILLRADPSRAAAEKRIAAIRDQLLRGADFAALARAHSDCESAQAGGDLGTICRDTRLPRAVISAAFSQDVSAIGPVVRSSSGFHVVQVLRHNKSEIVPFEELKAQLASQLKSERVRNRIGTLARNLMKGASIVRFRGQ